MESERKSKGLAGVAGPRGAALLSRCSVALAVALAAFAAGGARAQEKPSGSDWLVEPGLYGMIPGLLGTATIGPVDINLGQPSDAILSLNFFFMGNIRVGYKAWSFTSDIFHGNIHAESTNDRGNTNTGDFVETISDNTFGYMIAPWFEGLLGFRYDYISATLNGPFGHAPMGSMDWFDPIAGFNMKAKATDTLSLHLRADVGGFGIGSDLTWQVFPYVRWQFAKIVALQFGYRVLYVDYQQGEGLQNRRLIVTELGFQLGVIFTPQF